MGAQAGILPGNPQHLPARSWGPLSNQGLFLFSHVTQVKIWSDWGIRHLNQQETLPEYVSFSSTVHKNSPHLRYRCQQMASGTRLPSKAHGWREGRPEGAGTSWLTCGIPTSLSRCVMTQPCHQELLWGSTCTKGDLRLTCMLSASTFMRSDTHGRGIPGLSAVWLFSLFFFFFASTANLGGNCYSTWPH